MENTVKDRLIQFINSLGISIRMFEQQIGLSNGFVRNTGDSIRRNNLAKISVEYPILNIAWLLTGEGNMRNPEFEDFCIENKSTNNTNGNSNIVVGRDNNGHISIAECQNKLEDALLEIKHLKERLKDKEEMIEILKNQINK